MKTSAIQKLGGGGFSINLHNRTHLFVTPIHKVPDGFEIKVGPGNYVIADRESLRELGEALIETADRI